MTEREIFLTALDIPDPAARAAYLEAACADDPALRAGVDALFRSDESAGSFLMRPAAPRLDPKRVDTLPMDDGATVDDRANLERSLTFLTPSSRPDSLGRLGHYEVLEVLGRGGFGIVLRAFDESLHRVVAVKVLAPEMAATPPARKRFLREARSSAQLRHENVVQVHAVESEPLPYLVMNFIPGHTLQQRLDRTGPLEIPDVLEFGRQVAEGLAAAHDKGLIHRDIKPENILLESGPQLRAKITDFGLARTVDDADATLSGFVAGTPMFMSPEQARGEPVDHRSDLFSLGSVLYAMCTGRPPFRANGAVAVLKRVAEDTPRPIPEIIPGVPAWLCEIIGRLHAKKPDDRFQSAREVADLLSRHLEEMQRTGRPRSGAGLAPRAAGSSPAPAAVGRKSRRRAASALVLAAVAGLGFAESGGLTDLRATVIRLFSPEGTLVIEVDDPGVSVSIDDEGLVITGAGAREIRLKTGRHTFRAVKDGKVVRQELVTVTRDGRQVLRAHQEAEPEPGHAAGPGPKPERITPDVPGVAVSGAGPIRDTAARLKAANPGFRGTVALPRAAELEIDGTGLHDLSPVRAQPGVTMIRCFVRSLADLSGLEGMDLVDVSVRSTGVSDLRPLVGMKLTSFECSAAPVSDLSPLKGMPLRDLQMAYTPVSDLSPLKGMPLGRLNCTGCKALSDLTPLKGMPIRHLEVRDTAVSDLSPLKGMPLVFLDYAGTGVSDIAPLKETPLVHVHCDFWAERDAAILGSIPTLKTINDRPAAEVLGSR